jgi:DNA-binding Lrp family transcriptional regulator
MLSEATWETLWACELDAQQDAASIARQLGTKTSVVHRALQRLIAEGVILGQVQVVDLARLGLFEWGLHLQTEFRSARARQSFEQFLCGRRELSWLASCGGQYSYLCTILAATPHDAQASFRAIAASASDSLRQQLVFVRTQRYRLWAPSKKRPPAKRVRYVLGQSPAREVLSAAELAFLKSAEALSFWSYRELARQSRLSIASTLRAVQRLKARKILLGCAYRIDRERARLLQFRVLLRVNAASLSASSILQIICTLSAARLLTVVLGAWDYEVGLEVRSHDELTQNIDQLREALGTSLLSLETLPLYRQLKLISFPVGR